MHRDLLRPFLSLLWLWLLLGFFPLGVLGQEVRRLFPDRILLPHLLAGAREPVTSVALLGVTRNPNSLGDGVEAEVSVGSTLPVLLLGTPDGRPVVAGIEAGVYGRFGLQVLERELIASDWLFAVPVYWLLDSGWFRLRYFHLSSHMGDEYARRFDDPGINFARDAVELFGFRSLSSESGLYGGVRYAYIVHPEDSKRWVVRAGGQLDRRDGAGIRPFLAADLEWDQDAGSTPRIEGRLGLWLPEVNGRRLLRVSLSLLRGPSPLGQFHGRSTTQIAFGLQGNL